MKDKLFKTKRIEELLEASAKDVSLKRTLGPLNLISLGIGAIIGAGLFSLTGKVAAEHAGPAISISFIIAGVVCVFAGLCYAEFSSMLPIAGSAYTYSYATMGELMAWTIGWDLVLEYAVGAATVAISWSQYFVKLLEYMGIHFPIEFILSPWQSHTLTDGTVVHGIMNIPAVFIVLVISAVLIKGIQESAFMSGLIVILKVAVVITFIVAGYAYINPQNYVPYIPENTGKFGEFGWSGVLQGASILFFAFVGFDAVSTAAQEAKNPQRTMPIGILASLFICTILYILFAHVMTGLAHYTEFQGSQEKLAPVAKAISHTPYHWLNPLIILAILAGYCSVILVMLLGQSRVFYSMSRDGLLPKLFSETHRTFKTPWKSNIFFAVLVSLFAAFVPGDVVGEMTSIGTLFAFVLVCIGVVVMRKTHPNLPRGFKTPFVPLVPILGVITCLILMLSLPWDTWIRLIVWMAIGFIVYFTYGIKNSTLHKKSEN
jgi:basic amino acid/polyamine antiporter, APA family